MATFLLQGESMLYVYEIVVGARKARGSFSYGIADTDDGSIEYYNRNELQEILYKHPDIEINGVAFKNGTRTISGIETYQPELTPVQLKLQLMYGIDMRFLGTKITSISNLSTYRGATLRLSDFGTSCGDNIMKYYNSISYTLTLVLDDKIKIGMGTFDGPQPKFMIDVREVTKHKILWAVYASTLSHIYLSTVADYIVDNPVRMSLYTGLYIIDPKCRFLFERSEINGLLLGDTDKEILKMLRPSFDKLFASSPDISNLTRPNMQRLDSLVPLFSRLVSVVGSSAFTLGVILRYYSCIEDALAIVKGVNASDYVRLRRYIEYFGGSSELRESFVRFSERIVIWFNNLHLRG